MYIQYTVAKYVCSYYVCSHMPICSNVILQLNKLASYCMCTYSYTDIIHVDGAKCDMITCTNHSSFAVTDRGKVCVSLLEHTYYVRMYYFIYIL